MKYKAIISSNGKERSIKFNAKSFADAFTKAQNMLGANETVISVENA